MATTEDFRTRLRDWLAGLAAQHLDFGTDTGLAEARTFQAALHDAGFAGITWPAEYGGQGLSTAELQVYHEETAGFGLPTFPFTIGLGMCGPTIVDLGTEEQKRRYLRPLLRGEEIWCQLFSEPGAGSDVASLRTAAVADGDGWRVDGQKVWTSGAERSRFGALLARTDPAAAKHRGLTMFVVDMQAPGVTVRPLRDMTGRSPFNEVYFDDVRLPADAVLGTVNGGWAAALTMLGHERVSLGGAARGSDDPLVAANLLALAERTGRGDDAVVRDRLAEVHATELALNMFNARLREDAAAGRDPGARGSVAKLADALLQERKGDTACLIAGAELAAWPEDDTTGATMDFQLNWVPAAAIAGGTLQVQRTIIGERILGLPKEPT